MMKSAFEIAQHIARRLDEAELPYAIGGALARIAVLDDLVRRFPCG